MTVTENYQINEGDNTPSTSSPSSEMDFHRRITHPRENGLRQRIAQSTYFLITISMCGGLIFGYNAGIIAFALDPITALFELDVIPQGILVCSILLGALIGALTGGVVADKIGRKPVIIFTSLITIGGAVASGAVSSLVAINITRFLLGIGVGCTSSVCPILVAESAPKEKKSFCGSFFQIGITVGILLANGIGLALKEAGSYWRWMFAIGAVPGVMLFVCWVLMNESPVFLMKKAEQRSGVAVASRATVGSQNRFAMLFNKSSRKPMFLGVCLAILLQLTGINAFMYFSPNIFRDAGISGKNGPDIAAVILQVWNVGTTLIAMFLVERVGRKKLLITGSIIMTISDIIIAIVFLTGSSNSAAGWVSVVFLFIFVGAFEASIGTLFWFVVNEIMPEDIKATAQPVINAFQWLFNLILAFVFLTVVKYLGQSTMFWIFGGFGVFTTASLWVFLPDLKAAAPAPADVEQPHMHPVESETIMYSKKQKDDAFNKSSKYAKPAQEQDQDFDSKLKEMTGIAPIDPIVLPVQ
ncbi:sugar transporter family protein [Cavenderia fasciculata]|uniref:Sugar transporter family protein n=1 Tax=Cavenderia fasciculata TaxID=261658 RepID=F4PYI7_CACFS|nr:sugar transporter family protein [Cavenderia fasciculata]EGG19253.1 sugar transporter family protein [Cavenderia fasciculata]|eukprot:XP_004357524.1 sugar transporter family protein [Cavenderia fasciculata]